jgi:chromosome segregation ATPase
MREISKIYYNCKGILTKLESQKDNLGNQYSISQENLTKTNKLLTELQENMNMTEKKYQTQISAFDEKLKSLDKDSQKQIKVIQVQKLEIDGLRQELIELNKLNKTKDDKLSQLKQDVDKAKQIMSQKDNSEDVVKQFKLMIDKRDKRIKELETQLKQKK